MKKVACKQQKEAREDLRCHRLSSRNTINNLCREHKKEHQDSMILKDSIEKQRMKKCAALKRSRRAERRLASYEDKNKRLKAILPTAHTLKHEMREFKKVRHVIPGGKVNGGLTWPLWILQLILEMLVNGTPPSAIAKNIQSQAIITQPDIIVHDLPCERYVLNCCTNLRILGETLTAYRLAKADVWQQLFTDGTNRRQIALQNLIISIKEDDELRPLVLSSAIILEGESSEQQCNAILEVIQRSGDRLKRWAEVIEKMYPDYDHDIPVANQLNIGKLGNGGAVTSDTCNAARKTRRLLVTHIKEAAVNMSSDSVKVLEVDCWNQLRNV